MPAELIWNLYYISRAPPDGKKPSFYRQISANLCVIYLQQSSWSDRYDDYNFGVKHHRGLQYSEGSVSKLAVVSPRPNSPESEGNISLNIHSFARK